MVCFYVEGMSIKFSDEVGIKYETYIGGAKFHIGIFAVVKAAVAPKLER